MRRTVLCLIAVMLMCSLTLAELETPRGDPLNPASTYSLNGYFLGLPFSHSSGETWVLDLPLPLVELEFQWDPDSASYHREGPPKTRLVFDEATQTYEVWEWLIPEPGNPGQYQWEHVGGGSYTVL